MLIIFLCIVAIVAGYLMFDKVSDTIGGSLMLCGGILLLIFGIFFIGAHIPTIEANTKTQYEGIPWVSGNGTGVTADQKAEIEKLREDILKEAKS